MHRFCRIALGVAFVVGGVASFFLPFMPGLLFVFIGLMLLGNSRAREAVRRSRRKLHEWIGRKAAHKLLFWCDELHGDEPAEEGTSNPVSTHKSGHLRVTGKTFKRSRNPSR